MGVVVENLSVSRGGVQLLDGVGFSVDDGKSLALKGPNGVGKTSLLRTLVGLQNSSRGTVTPEADSFCYLGHSDSIKHALTVGENLKFWADIYGSEQSETVVAQLGLSDLIDRIAGELSAGQMRRVGLARLPLSGRKNWVMDEPTVGLDDTNRDRLGALVNDHLGQGGCVIAATHVGLPFLSDELDISEFRAVYSKAENSFDEAFV